MTQNFRLLPNFPEEDVDRVKYFLNKTKYIDFMLATNDIKTEKCLERALSARNDGNRKFIEKNNVAALKAYNESLCWAPVGSESIGMAYANRSAIYLKCGFYKYCLENIGLAFQNNYPERLKLKLVKRKEECLQKMKVQKDSTENYDYKDLTKLSYPANSKIPFIIDGLQLKTNKKYRRYVVTTRDLKPGDIVMIEKPFIKSPDHQKTVYCQCFYCCKSYFFNLTPCPKSTKIMFCSEQCAKDAWREFYQHECPIMDEIIDHKVALECHVFFKAFSVFGDLFKLEELMDLAEENSITVFDENMNEADEITKFRILFSLNVCKVGKPHKLAATYGRASLIYSLLKKLDVIKKILKTQKN